MSWAIPIATTLLGHELNKPSENEKWYQQQTQQAGAKAGNAQAEEIQDNLRRKRELEAEIKALKPLTKEQKEALFQIRPGKSPDFGPVGSTRQLEMLQQLIGGIGQGQIGQNQALAAQQDQFRQQQTSNTTDALTQWLLGLLGPGGGSAAKFNQGLGASGTTVDGWMNLMNNIG